MCYGTTHSFTYAAADSKPLPDWLVCQCGAITIGDVDRARRGRMSNIGFIDESDYREAIQEEIAELRQQLAEKDADYKTACQCFGVARELASEYEEKLATAQQRIEELEAEIARLTSVPLRSMARKAQGIPG